MARKKAPQIVSVDPGNGGTTAVCRGTSLKSYHYLPSVRAIAHGDTLGLGKRELEYQYYDWYGTRYVAGDDVLDVTGRAQEHHIGAERYGGEFQQFMIAAALANLGIQTGAVDLTLCAPPGLFKQARSIMEQELRGKQVEIRLRSDKKPRQWCYENVTVWPEGFEAVFAILFDESGKGVVTDALDGNVAIIDIGVFTLDVLTFQHGRLNVEYLDTATIEHGGLDVHLRQFLLRDVQNLGPDFKHFTVDHIDRALRHGKTIGEYHVTSAGKMVEITDWVNYYASRYANWIANNVVDQNLNALNGYNTLIFVGGGAMFIEDYFLGWERYRDRIFDRKAHATTRKIFPFDLNAYGGLRARLAAI